MNRTSIGLATCLVAAVTAGCGTVTASQPVTGGHTTVGGHTVQTPGTASRGPASPGPAGTGAPLGCRSAVPGGQVLLITMSGNAKTYCVRVGQQVEVQLRGTRSSHWLAPLASSNALRPVPHGELSLVAGLTEEWFTGVRPGQVRITSVRPPCQGSIRKWESGIEPANPLPQVYPLRACAPERRFSVSIVVVS